MEPYFLTLDRVIKKGREAFKAHELSAQGKTPACRYRDRSGNPCIIGAALPKRIVDNLTPYLMQQPVYALVKRNIIEIEIEHEEIITQIQNAHDEWAQGDKVGKTKSEAAKKRLKELLGLT